MKPSSNPSAIHRPHHPQSTGWHFYVVATVCCAVLVAGFFFAARQHFSSMEFGLQNSKLRRQVDQLESEKRRLLVSREISMSPGELRKAAKRTGSDEAPLAQVISDKRPTALTVVPVKTTSTVPASKVIKTVISTPVNKPPVIGKQARKDAIVTRKDRT
jgi:hypothetical protein